MAFAKLTDSVPKNLFSVSNALRRNFLYLFFACPLACYRSIPGILFMHEAPWCWRRCCCCSVQSKRSKTTKCVKTNAKPISQTARKFFCAHGKLMRPDKSGMDDEWISKSKSCLLNFWTRLFFEEEKEWINRFRMRRSRKDILLGYELSFIFGFWS